MFLLSQYHEEPWFSFRFNNYKVSMTALLPAVHSRYHKLSCQISNPNFVFLLIVEAQRCTNQSKSHSQLRPVHRTPHAPTTVLRKVHQNLFGEGIPYCPCTPDNLFQAHQAVVQNLVPQFPVPLRFQN